MAGASSNVAIDSMSLTTANTYKHYGKVQVQSGGHYSSKTEIHAGVYHHHHDGRQADPLQSLYEHSSMDALHSSGERVDAPRCHEQTREAVQRDILSRLSDGDGSQGLIWLTGPAGCGKTAIVGTVCDRLKAYKQMAAAFYFSSHKGSVKRKSKRFFVATLAYQMQSHPVLGKHISHSMFSAIRHHPGIFEMDLRTQMEELILKPFRAAQGTIPSSECGTWVVAADGIDECGEGDGRSREKDQVEVLNCLLQAIQDASFPCRIVLASRPERCIRHFFQHTAQQRFTEIFLDDKYSPNDDIELYFRSSFDRLCRDNGYDPSAWPNQLDIQQLVTDASGQFIYAATVVRFIDSPHSQPKDQLDIILRLRPPAGEQPLQTLDALYIAILESSATEAVIWLKAIEQSHRSPDLTLEMQPSAWTTDRFFEATEGQARRVLGIPSLLYVREDTDNDYSKFSSLLRRSGDLHRSDDQRAPTLEQRGRYAFYHKSFLDFLEDPARSHAAFPNATPEKVGSWIWGCISKNLERGGPVVPLGSLDLDVFRLCVVYHIARLSKLFEQHISPDAISQSDPMTWIPAITFLNESLPQNIYMWDASYVFFVGFHSECHLYRPCTAGCRRWRRALLSEVLTQRQSWKAALSLVLDRFCIRRLRYIDTWNVWSLKCGGT